MGILLMEKKNMHRFEELIYRSTSFTLEVLEETNSKIIDALQTSGSTILVEKSSNDSIPKGNICYWYVFYVWCNIAG